MIETITSPTRDWLPVFLPGMYLFGFTPDEWSAFDTPTLSNVGGKVVLNWPISSVQPTPQPYTFWRFADTAELYRGVTAEVISYVTDIVSGSTITLDLAHTGPDSAPDGVLITGSIVAPVVTIKIEVSSNAVDFSDPITAGLSVLPANSADQYPFNPHSFLESQFEPGSPVFGTDLSLFKYYRLLVGPAQAYDGTIGTPAIVTTPARVLYASELTSLGVTTTTLSLSPFTANTNALPAIKTVIASNVVSSSPQPLEVSAPCPPYPINLYWLNRQGGWNSFVFSGKHEYQEDIPEAVYFEDYMGYQHKAAIKPMRNQVAVFSGFITSDRYDMVRSIRSAIRVFQGVPEGMETVFREVNIKGGTFPIKKEGVKLYECNFSFTYAAPVLIQTS